MKRNQLLVLSVLVFGLQGVAQASPYPADAEAVAALPEAGSISFIASGKQAGYPADAEASLGMPGLGDEKAWGVSERRGASGSPFPVSGEFRVDD